MAKSHWDECNHPDCRKFYWNDRGNSTFCSMTCARSYEHLSRRPSRPELMHMIDQFLAQPEVNHDPRLKRAVWRVFGQ